MSATPSPEERVHALVVARSKEPGGPWFVELRELLQPAVYLGPYQNPSIAQDDARRVREFLAAVMWEARRQAAETTGQKVVAAEAEPVGATDVPSKRATIEGADGC
jgi:hypothetical protein